MLPVDANVFLELFLGRGKADECERFLWKVPSGELEAVVSKFTIHAIEAVLNDSEPTNPSFPEKRPRLTGA